MLSHQEKDKGDQDRGAGSCRRSGPAGPSPATLESWKISKSLITIYSINPVPGAKGSAETKSLVSGVPWD